MRARILVFLTFCALQSPRLRAGININVDAVRKSVVFLYGADSQSRIDTKQEPRYWRFVEVQLKSDPQKVRRSNC